jgi:hypothetical protein
MDPIKDGFLMEPIPDPTKTHKFPYEGGEWPIVSAVVMWGPGENQAVLAVSGEHPTPWGWLPCWWCNWYLSPITAGLCPYCGHHNDPTPYQTGIRTIDGQTVDPVAGLLNTVTEERTDAKR